MGVYIKDMEKPKSCAECELWSLCFYPKAPREIDDRVMPDCPIEEVDLVRCGECKHLKADGTCDIFADDNIRPSASDFCSYGERRTDEE